jgi:perosamine synthetase
MVVTGDPELARRIRLFRNHGIAADHKQRALSGTWYYEMTALGYNYRLSDLQCALGMSQLRKLPRWLARRREIAQKYASRLRNSARVRPLKKRPENEHAYHLYVIRLLRPDLGISREEVFKRLRQRGVGVNVHYIPVHLHPFYRETFGTRRGLCPVAEKAYDRIISLPLFPAMTDDEVEYVLASLEAALGAWRAKER